MCLLTVPAVNWHCIVFGTDFFVSMSYIYLICKSFQFICFDTELCGVWSDYFFCSYYINWNDINKNWKKKNICNKFIDEKTQKNTFGQKKNNRQLITKKNRMRIYAAQAIEKKNHIDLRVYDCLLLVQIFQFECIFFLLRLCSLLKLIWFSFIGPQIS